MLCAICVDSCLGTVAVNEDATYDRRYTEVWELRGHDTLAIRPRISSIVIPPFGDRQVAGALANIRAVQSAHPGRRTVYHIFRHAVAVCPALHLKMILCSFTAAAHLRRRASCDVEHTYEHLLQQ